MTKLSVFKNDLNKIPIIQIIKVTFLFRFNN